MANAQPEHRTDESPLIASALRTLDTEAGGVAALIAAIRGTLSLPFIAAVELISRSVDPASNRNGPGFRRHLRGRPAKGGGANHHAATHGRRRLRRQQRAAACFRPGPGRKN